MVDPANYISVIESALMTSEVIAKYTILDQWTNTDDGYFRIRATLNNGDFLEAANYFVVEDERSVTIDYRYQWMDHTRTILRRRWDNTPHHPEVPTFPHHCHVEDEANVLPGAPMSLLQLLLFLKSETAI